MKGEMTEEKKWCGCDGWSVEAKLVLRGAEGCCGGSRQEAPAACSLTLHAGSHQSVSLSCGPARAPSRDVASQTSHSLIPHLLQQLDKTLGEKKDDQKSSSVGKRILYTKGQCDKKPMRTVHIDVYCTESSEDSEFESEASKETVVGRGEKAVNLRREPRRWWGSSQVSGVSSGYPSSASVHPTGPTDSFDYANSQDRLRILAKEKEWAVGRPTSSTSSSSSSSTSGEELAWSFADDVNSGVGKVFSQPVPITSAAPSRRLLPQTFGPIPHRPDRHIGPTKNPNCPCNTCKFHFSKSPPS